MRRVLTSVAAFGISLCFCPLAARAAQAQPAKYDSRVTARQNDSVVQVYERRTRRIIWTHTYSIESPPVWSPDHRSVAFAIREKPSQFSVVYWRAGGRAHTVEDPDLASYDYVERMKWSPGSNSFFVMVGGSTEAERGTGHLFCVDAAGQRLYYLGDTIYAEVRWAGPRTVKFWKIYYLGYMGQGPEASGIRKARRPTYWRVPGSHIR